MMKASLTLMKNGQMERHIHGIAVAISDFAWIIATGLFFC